MTEPTNQKPSQIRIGAGLEESRLNQDFVDFLKAWSTPLLLIAAVSALGFIAYGRYKKSQLDTIDAAFRDLENASATLTPSPDSLASVATQYESIGAVSEIARLRAGDSLLFSLQTGLKPGAQLNDDGSPKAADDVLSDTDRTSLLAQAQGNYQAVLDETQKNPAQRPLTFGALFGLAAVAESKGDMPAAKSLYERIIALVETDAPVKKSDGTEGGRPFALHAVIAKKRIENLPTLANQVALVSEKNLPKLPELPKPPAPALPPTLDLNTLPPSVPPTTPTTPPAETPVMPPATPATPVAPK